MTVLLKVYLLLALNIGIKNLLELLCFRLVNDHWIKIENIGHYTLKFENLYIFTSAVFFSLHVLSVECKKWNLAPYLQ